MKRTTVEEKFVFGKASRSRCDATREQLDIFPREVPDTDPLEESEIRRPAAGGDFDRAQESTGGGLAQLL
jgi:hypothetical protein